MAPEGRHEDSQDRQGFQAAHEHGQAEGDFAERRQGRTSSRRTELAESRPAAAHGRDTEADGIEDGHAVKDHDERPEDAEHGVDEEEFGYAVNEVHREFFAIRTDVQDHVGMYLLADDGGNGLDQQHDARHFQAACRRAGTAADEHQDQEDEFGKDRPLFKVVGDEARRRRNGHGLEKGLAQGFDAVPLLGQDQVEGHGRRRDGDDGQVDAELRIAEDDFAALLPGRDVHAEVGAADEHEKGQAAFNDRAVEMGDAVIVRRETARSDSGKGVVGCDKEGHAAEHEDDRRGNGKDDVHREQGLGHLLDARQGPVRTGACAFGIEHVDDALAELRKDSDEDDDDTQAAEPVGQGPPEDQAGRHGFDVVDDRRPRAGQAGNTFKDTVQDGQIAAGSIRNHAQESDHDPAQGRNGHAFADSQAVRRPMALPHEQAPYEEADDDGHEERNDTGFPIEKGDDKGNHQGQPAGLGQFPQDK